MRSATSWKAPPHGYGSWHAYLEDLGGGRAVPLEQRHAAVDEAVVRLTDLGLTRLYEQQEQDHYHATMQDPEGNELCLR